MGRLREMRTRTFCYISLTLTKTKEIDSDAKGTPLFTADHTFGFWSYGFRCPDGAGADPCPLKVPAAGLLPAARPCGSFALRPAVSGKGMGKRHAGCSGELGVSRL